MKREEAIQWIKTVEVLGFDEKADWIQNALDMAIDALEENESLAKSLNDATELIHKLQKKNEWIPCSERLPKPYASVLVCSDIGNIEISHGDVFDSTGEFEWFPSGWKFGNVVAWMPLPEAFKEDES